MRLVNLTKQTVRLHDTEGVLVEIPPDPRHVGLVSVGEHRTISDENGHEFSLNVQRMRGVKGMPDPADGTLYLVPVEIALALQPTRTDVVYVGEDADIRMANGTTRRISHLRRLTSTHSAPKAPKSTARPPSTV